MGKADHGHIIRLLLACITALLLSGSVAGQSVNPVYIEDSPRAAELLLRAQAQAADNAGEAVRLLQEVLDDYALRLVPADTIDRDRFVSARRRAMDTLRRSADLRTRYRNMETTEAQRLLDAGELERLALTRSLTAPGLTALLTLAQQHVESGRFRSALARLDEAAQHPDLGAPLMRHAWLLEGLAAHHLGRGGRAADALARLNAAGEDAAPFAAYLRKQMQNEPLPAPLGGVTVYDRADTEELDRLVTQAIWTADLAIPHAPEAESEPNMLRPRRRLRPAVFESPGITPTITRGVIYVNEGSVIRAFNRFTARPVWTQPYRDPQPQFGDLRGEESPGDLSLVTAWGDRLVALSGQSEELGMMSHGAVVCLDAGTGRMRWKTGFGAPGSQMPEGLFPHGQPIVFEEHVLVLARQVTPERLTGTYVVSLDLDSGRVRWVRFVASSGNRSSISRPLSTLAMYDDRLLITTPIGATALMRPGTGEIDWLRRESVPSTFRETSGRIFEVTGPVILRDSVYVLAADRRSILVMDARDGTMQQRVDAGSRDGWNNPAYLLGDDHHIYGIGTEVRAFTIDQLDRPIWSFPSFVQPESVPAANRPVQRIAPSGRVQIATDALLVPTRDGLFILDGDTGRPVRRLDLVGPGHPIADGAQLIHATADQLGSFMSIERAEDMLRDRIAADPSDPRPAISLGQLGLRTDNVTMVLEASKLALESSARSADEAAARRELFSVLLDTHRAGLTAPEADMRALYAIMDRAAQHKADRVEYLLAHAAWLTPFDPAAAAERCRLILSDAALAQVERAEDDVLRPANWWAVARMNELVRLHGPQIRAGEDARAAAQFTAARTAGDESALLAVARTFPASPVAVDATIAAADLALRRGRGDEARGHLLAALHRQPDLAMARPLLTHLFTITPDNAVRARLLVDLIPMLRDIPVAIAGISRSLRAHAPLLTSVSALPELGALQSSFRLIPGSLVPPATGAQHLLPPTDIVLVIDTDRVRAHEAQTLTQRWEAPLDDRDVQMLAADEKRIMLFSPGRSNDPRFGDQPSLMCLGTGDGDLLWRTDPIDRLLNLPLLRARTVQELMPNQLPFDPTEIIAASLDDRAYLIRRSGSALAFNLDGSGDPEWTSVQVLDQVHHAIATPAGLVLIGRERVDDLDPPRGLPVIAVLDRQNGTVRSRLRPHTLMGVTWAKADSLGRLLIGSREGVELLDLYAGQRLWANRSSLLTETRAGWMGGAAAVAEDRTGLLHLVDVASGRARTPLDPIVPGDWEQSQVESVHPDADGTWLVRFAGRIVRYADTGEVIGADAIGEMRNFVGIVLAADGPVLLSLHDNRQVRQPGEDRLRMQRTYHIYPLHHDGRLRRETFALPPLLKRIQSFAGVRGWLLLSSDSETIAVPARPSG